MNYKMMLSILGKTFIITAFLMLFPACVGFYYGNDNFISFLVPVAILLAIGAPLSLMKIKDKSMYAKEGFVTVALAWIFISLIGALPFVISGEIPNYINAFFETVSGFTTTGASILSDVEVLSESMMFWRLFTHWIGGMGVLVFVLAIMPGYNAGIMHLFRAESPGPSVDKLVSKLTRTARILYGIYIAMTIVQIVLLAAGGNSLYESTLLSFSTAGTGGFGILNSSAASYSLYTKLVLAIFMFIFSINFNFYYLILIRQVKKAFKSEEVRIYVIIVAVATIAITLNILSTCVDFGQAITDAFFQVSSISSTTGLTTVDFDAWPAFSKGVLFVLMAVGACGGSTGGGMKVSRLGILIKSTVADFKKLIHPRAVVRPKFEGQVLDRETENNVKIYFVLWILILILSTLLLSLDVYGDLFSNLSATLACISNVGPGFGAVGPMLNYSAYSELSKVLLSFVMLIGRLEIFPMLILFAPRTWKKG